MRLCRAVYILHAHVYFREDDADQLESAKHFKAQLEAEFGADGLVKVGPLVEHAQGPHPCGNFELAFTRDQTTDVLLYLQMHRPSSMSVLVHPFTTLLVSHSCRLVTAR